MGTLGKHWTLNSEQKMARRMEGNPAWKGNKVGYAGLHVWIYKNLGQPKKCEHCGKDGLTGKKIQWANKKHSYSRNLKDWIRLCASCHTIFDGNWKKRVRNIKGQFS